MKAYRTLVDFYGHSIEVVMDDNKDLYITVPQLNELTSLVSQPTDASRSLKRLMGKEFLTAKLSVEGTQGQTSAFPISCFKSVLRKLDKAGNPKASELVDDLIDIAIDQIAYDAFGVKFEKEERELHKKLRMQSKDVRRTFTDSVKLWGEINQTKPNYGKLTAIFYNITGLKKGRDTYTDKELKHLIWCEEFIARKIDRGFSPEQALAQLKTVA